jgi:hypothetical protein
LFALAEEVACRAMDEAFRGGATDVDQAVERIVVIAGLPLRLSSIPARLPLAS